MNRFSLPSNIYNSHELIKTASELGITLFKKFNNNFIFKTLIAGNNISISETDNFITISNNQSSNYKRFFISGFTDDTPILKLKSSSDIYLNVIGKIGDYPISYNSINDDYIGIHTHDINLTLIQHESLEILYNTPGIPFEIYINAFSKNEIIIESNYLINYLS